MKYSFIIPTRDRPKEVDNLLSDLERIADRSEAEFEVILFNDGDNQKTKEILGQDKNFDLITLSSEERLNSAVTRNRCIEKAQGKWLIFLDDDVRLKPDFLEKAAEIGRKFKGFSFRMELPRKENTFPLLDFMDFLWPGRIFPWLGYFTAGFDRQFKNIPRVSHLPGANMIFKRSVVSDVRFDEFIGEGTGYLDDADFSFSVKENAGIELAYISDYSIVHLQTPAGGNRELDESKWFYYYQLHKFYFFEKHFNSMYRSFVIFFNFWDAVLRSLIKGVNLLPQFFKALRDEKET